MASITIYRTVTVRVRIDSEDLADTLGIEEEQVIRYADDPAGLDLGAYISDYCQDGDDTLFIGADVTQDHIRAGLTDSPAMPGRL